MKYHIPTCPVCGKKSEFERPDIAPWLCSKRCMMIYEWQLIEDVLKIE